MDNQDHTKVHTPGQESHGVHLCRKCGWPFPNPHPSAKHRRAHKRICGTIEGYKLFDSEGTPHSDDSDDDHKMPSPKPVTEISKNEKGSGEIGEKIDEVFSDAVTDFSDVGSSPDSANNAGKIHRKDSKPSEFSENKAACVGQFTVQSSEDIQRQNPEASIREEVGAGKSSELLGQPSSFTVEPSPLSDSDLKTEASKVVHSDDSSSVPSNLYCSEASKAEAIADVIPEMNEVVSERNLTSAAETNLKGMDNFKSERDTVEIAKSSVVSVDEVSEKPSIIEVSNEVASTGEMVNGAAVLDREFNANLSSVVPHDNALPSDSVSAADTTVSTNVVQMESKHILQFATSTGPVNGFQEKGEGGVDVFTLSNPDLAHSQSDFENCKGLEGEETIQNPLGSHSFEPSKHQEDDLKITSSVTEEYHIYSKSNQLTEEKEVLSSDKHALDDSIKQGTINIEPMVEVTAEGHAEVSHVEKNVDCDNRSIEIGTSEYSLKSEMSKTCTVSSSEELGPGDVGKNLQHKNLSEGSVMVSPDDDEDFKDCEEVVAQKSFNNIHPTEGLKDIVNEESRFDFNSSHLNKESEIISLDEPAPHHESQVDNALTEEQTLVEGSQRSDDIPAFMNAMNTEKNESQVSDFSVEQKIGDACKTSQEKGFPEDTVLSSSKENIVNASIESSPGQTSVVNRDGTSLSEERRNDLDAFVLDSESKGGDRESDTGIKVGTFQPSDLLPSEGKTSRDLVKSDNASETDKNYTQGWGASLVKNTPSPNSGITPFESQAVAEDVTDEQAKKPTGMGSTGIIDVVPGIKEGTQGEIINNKVQEECNTVSGTCTPQVQDTEPSKAVEKHAGELPPHSHLDIDQSSQPVPDNITIDPSGEASGTSVVTATDRTGNSSVKFGSSVIDASVDSNSRCDSLEGNWGSVSVLSVQSDVPATTEGEALSSAEAGKSNWNTSKSATQGPQSDIHDVFEPPSFMTLVKHDSQKAGASEEGDNSQLNPASSEAAWFPTITQGVNDSQGRKKNEEIIAKVTNWSANKQSSTPLKSLLGEAANSNKPKSPKMDENQASSKNGKVAIDNGSGLKTVNSILGPESPAAQAMRDEAGKEWNSPARYPADIKREKRKVKNRPYWAQFVCCSSVDPR